MKVVLGALACSLALGASWQTARAMPVGPDTFCEANPSSPLCASGPPPCTLCHTQPPERNSYGTDVGAELLPGMSRPISAIDFAAGLPAALAAVTLLDSDGDGISNGDEIAAGTWPGDPSSPEAVGECGEGTNPAYDVCNYDPRWAYKRVHLDFCGRSPTYPDWQAFAALDRASQDARIRETLDECLLSEFWRGKDGVLWEIAHTKILPVASIKAGEDAGSRELSDYYDDYHLFTYTQTDGRDARDILLADYHVLRTGPTTYERVEDKFDTQPLVKDRRAGLLTTDWNLFFHVQLAALPRTAAAIAYRAYLGFNIALQEGLSPVPNEPLDYDAKGVAQAECAVCHSTLDPLTYPFTRYNGAGQPRSTYMPDRLTLLFADESPQIGDTPEAGVLFGQPVADLLEWASVAANSDAFASNTVNDYWSLLVGAPADPAADEFVNLWQRFRGEQNHSVEAMLRDLVTTEAYGAP